MIVQLPSLETLRMAAEQEAQTVLAQMGETDLEILASMLISSPGSSDAALERLEQAIGYRLAAGARAVISSYEIGGLEWCGVVFGGDPSFAAFLERQAKSQRYAESVHSTFFTIASSSGYELRMRPADDSVFARSLDDRSVPGALVARSLDLLLRALGALHMEGQVNNVAATAAAVAALVGAPGSEGFWSDRILGYG